MKRQFISDKILDGGDKSEVTHTVMETIFQKQIFTKYCTSPLGGDIFIFATAGDGLVGMDHYYYRSYLCKHIMRG